MKNYLMLSFNFLLVLSIHSQTIAKINVSAGKYDRNNSLVTVNISHLTSLPDSSLYLEEITKSGKIKTVCQIENGQYRILQFIMEGNTKAGNTRQYELKQGSPIHKKSVINTNINEGVLLLSQNEKNILQYNCKTTYPPAGVDSAYRRSGYIHPLWSPKGNVLTNIQPNDHYHHYGIWNPWTKTSFKGKEIDFWNLSKKQGTIRHDGLLSTTQGNIYSGFKAHHTHLVYPDSSAVETALNEVWDVRVYNLSTNYRICDFTSTMSCAGSNPLVIEEYRYQGFGFRANADWTKENAEYLTSEGKTRKDADNTRARWCIVSGESIYGRSGIIFMASPSNYNSPEPIRIWDENQNNGRGDVFFNFCPTKTKSWQLNPGNEYTLKYRMLIFDDKATKEEAEAAYIDFTNPPTVEVNTNQ